MLQIKRDLRGISTRCSIVGSRSEQTNRKKDIQTIKKKTNMNWILGNNSKILLAVSMGLWLCFSKRSLSIGATS